MIKILFIKSEKAYLPEVNAYLNYFKQTSEFSAYDSSAFPHGYRIGDFDVIWEFKGLGGIKRKDKLLVHEYASLSMGVCPIWKNFLKRKLNIKPDLRIFLNKNVKNGFPFHDRVDYCYRDMGIDESFIKAKSEKKEYEFVYIGTICPKRGIDILLQRFVEKKPGKLCLVGDVPKEIYNKYKFDKDIIFTGKVPYMVVPHIASKAIYGINFIPDRYPFNIQTSTKLLEYLALGLKVITTDYQWVRGFEKKHNCSFYKLDGNNNNLDRKSIEAYAFKTGFKATNFLWHKIIDKSGVAKKILSRIKL